MTFHTAEFQSEFDAAQREAQGEPHPLTGEVEPDQAPDPAFAGMSIAEIAEVLDEQAREAAEWDRWNEGRYFLP